MHTIEKTNGATTIRFNGDMKIERANAAKIVICEALADGGAIHIDLGEIGNADLSFFQVLCSAHRTAQKTNKTLDITGSPRDEFKRSLRGTGFSQTCALGMETYKNCLWTKIAA
jgi:ABC-type transporter Mla MlaB component